MIKTSGLTKRYRKEGEIVVALKDFNLSVEKGSFVLVRGRSGSGKTTLLNLLAGLARPSAGEVEMAGARVDQMGGAEATAFRARHIGVVFQMFHLIPYLSLLENILLPVLAPGNGGGNGTVADPQARAQELLQSFGLAEPDEVLAKAVTP